jgi:hypothetical protein
MARRISTGISGKNVLGSIVAVGNSLRSVKSNDNLVLDPEGTGIVASTAHFHLNEGSSVRLFDDDTSNYVAIKSPATVSSNITFTLPGTSGTSGYVLTTDGSGTLSWSQAVTDISNNTTDTTTHYVTLSTQTSGGVSGLRVTDSKLSFVPSTGVLTVTGISTSSLSVTGAGVVTLGNVDINGGNIDGTTIGSASAAAGTFTTLTATSITETSSIALKENISPITGALDAIQKLVGVVYDRKDGSSVNEAGLIKEEVEKVLPNLVNGDGVHYTKLTAYLIEAVKELTQEVNRLKSNNS